MDPPLKKRGKNKPRKSCDQCYKRKIKCDQQEPVCGSCYKSKLVCIYTRAVHYKRSCNTCLEKHLYCDTLLPSCASCLKNKTPCCYSDQPAPVKSATIADFDISKAFSKLQLAPLFAETNIPEYITDPITRAKVMENFTDHMTDSALRPYLPYELLLREPGFSSPSDTDAVLSAGALMVPDVLELHRANKLSKSHLLKYYRDFFMRMEELTVFDVAAQHILSRPVFYLDARATPVWRLLYTTTFFNTEIDKPPPKANNKLEHLSNCMRINAFWNMKMADNCFALYFNKLPRLANAGMDMPLPVTKEHCYDPDIPVSNLTLANISSPESSYVAAPPGMDVYGCACVIIVIETKIRELNFAKDLSPFERRFRLESLFCSLADWRLKFEYGPTTSRVESLVWAGMVEVRYWGLYLQLLSSYLEGYFKSPSKSHSAHVHKCVEAASTIAHIIRLFGFQFGISFERLPGCVIISLHFATHTTAMLIKYHKDPSIVENAKRDLQLLISFFTECSSRMVTIKALLETLKTELKNLDMNIEEYECQWSPMTVKRLSIL